MHFKQPVAGLYASGVDAPKAYLSDSTVVGRHAASSKDGAISAREGSTSIELVDRYLDCSSFSSMEFPSFTNRVVMRLRKVSVTNLEIELI